MYVCLEGGRVGLFLCLVLMPLLGDTMLFLIVLLLVCWCWAMPLGRASLIFFFRYVDI